MMTNDDDNEDGARDEMVCQVQLVEVALDFSEEKRKTSKNNSYAHR
jgi:hypothetical protein